MNLHKLIFTDNDCYKSGKTMVPKGIMVHSTGANNPRLKRYVGPDDGLLGKNQYNNHWNQHMERQVCVHGFIGKLENGEIAAYQTLPWNMVGWHSGSGSQGSANYLGYIGFEICEDDLTGEDYFNKVYTEAVELCVHLCKQYALSEKNIICHSEGHTLGITSNHGDIMHWWPKFGKNMDTFRSDVKAGLQAIDSTDDSDEIAAGSIVSFKTDAGQYYPGGGTIPSWVKNDYYHIVTQTMYRGNPVVKGGALCVLLGKKFKKNTNDKEAGINTWTALSNLDPVDSVYFVYTVVKGDTLWKLSKKYLGKGSRYTEIAELNDLKNNTIISGQELKIPNC